MWMVQVGQKATTSMRDSVLGGKQPVSFRLQKKSSLIRAKQSSIKLSLTETLKISRPFRVFYPSNRAYLFPPLMFFKCILNKSVVNPTVFSYRFNLTCSLSHN